MMAMSNKTDPGTAEADAFWAACLAAHSSSTSELEVRQIVQHYADKYGPVGELDRRCLVAILAQGQPNYDTARLKKNDFVLFLSRFGPLKMCLKKVRNILTEGRLWFHGNGDRDHCLRLLDNLPNNDKAFLVRYSTRSPGAFSIHYVKNGQARIFNGITNNLNGEGISVASDSAQTLTYSTFSSFISKNQHLFSKPCPGTADDPFQKFKDELNRQIADAESSSTIYNLVESFNPEEQEELDRVSAALEKCRISADHTVRLSGLDLEEFPEVNDGSGWTELNQSIADYSVDLSINDLKSLPPTIHAFVSNASTINLARNKLSKLVPTFSLLRNLRVLDLSHNRFADIPTELYKLKHLEELRMTNNFLIYIPNVFFEEMIGLKVLDLSKNRIVELPSTVCRLPTLEALRLGNNQLRWLPNELRRCVALKVFDVRENHIHKLPKAIIPLLSHIKDLDISHNEFDAPAEILSGGTLKILNWFNHAESDDEDEADLVTETGDDFDDDFDEDEIYTPDAMKLNPETPPAASNYAEPPELPPFSKKKNRKNRWERYQAQPLHNYCVVDNEALRSSGRRRFLGRDSREVRERRPTLTASSILSLPNSDLRIEAGDPQAPFSSATFAIDTKGDCSEYSKYFITKLHTNFVGVDPVVGALTITIAKEKDSPSSVSSGRGEFYRALIRTADEDKLWDIPSSLVKESKKAPSSKELLKALLKVTKPHLSAAKMRVVRQKNAQAQFLKLDNVLRMPQQFRFGIIFAKDGQTTEQEFYDNPVGSPAFKHFLDFLGDRIRLKGWKRHRAGLDVKGDSTGTESYFTTFENFEIMFHVSTMLPLLPNDPNRLERKRHIGNDVVVVIFKETQKGKPSSPLPINFASHMTHVYVVVEIDHASSKDDQVVYRVNIAYKDDVPESEPLLPSPPVFEEGELFRTLLLTKLINAERAAYNAAELRMANKRKRKAILEDLEKDVFPKIKKRDEDKTKSYYLPIPSAEWPAS